MEQRSLEITVISAKGLKKVKHLSKMDVYVIATISGDHRAEQKTPVDKDGDTSPKWNHCMKFTIDETLAKRNQLIITFKIKCDRTLCGDKDIGEVHVPVKELLDSASDSNSTKYATYPVREDSGKQKATSSSMYPPPEGPVAPAYPPVAYQPPAQGGGYGYPPPAPPAGYPQPPPRSAGYPPVGPGYGYPPAVQPQRKNEFGGLGTGAAFVGGLLGGLLVGDLVSDAADGFDAGDFCF